ncbi:O-antigen/teichoic acid export membrane protein [Novosphingobium sp. SG751A]|uniref:oligosaccharide flippase family protein n=1 Tax=Novosphingobium sp. SG751A TaxID=2587000 RepID=UPI001553F5B8|nr:oligosaccharide flippase family protein [Novosphingobium sp. SG751A]NOW46454.1 O-antigen/teichoic acid export membrane protein [Novosphingobium sp. SG751A]
MSSGVSLVAVTIIASNLLRIASTIILTRVLSPLDFGVTGLTGAILNILLMISDVGFGVYIIRHARGDDGRLLDVIWTVRLVRGAGLTLLLAAFAGPLAGALGKPELGMAIAVTALQFVLDGCSSLAPFTAVRDEKLAMLSLLDIAGAVTQTVAGVALALWLHSYWAIIWAGLIGTGIKSLLSYTLFPHAARRFACDAHEARELWRFGRTIAGAHTIQVLLSNVDKIALSRIFPLGLFGLYSLAVNLSGAASGFTTLYPSRILLPAFARAQREGPGQLALAYYDKKRAMMVFYMIAMGGFIAMAPSLVDLLYDPRYQAAATYLRALALAPAIAMNNYAAREVLIVVGRIHTLLYANLVRLVWLLLAGVGGFVGFGPLGLVVAVGCIELPVQVYCWYELRRAGLLRIGEEALILAGLLLGIVLGMTGNLLYGALSLAWRAG